MFCEIFLSILCLILATFAALYQNFQKKKVFWKNKKIPYKEPEFWWGNFKEAGSKNLGKIFRELYEEAKHERFYGVWQFNVPVLLVIDLELVKSILVSDFSSFDDHGVYINEETDPLSVNLLTVGGSTWQSLRAKLNPAFTAGKLKLMFPNILKCGKDLKEVLYNLAKEKEVIEFKELFSKYTTDVISSCAFGIDSSSLKNENAIFRVMGKEVFQSSWEVLWRNFVGFLFPNFAKLFKIRIYPQRITNFFVSVIREAIDFREKNNIQRNDILQALIQLKNEGFVPVTEKFKNNQETNASFKKELFTYEQAAAQAFIFFTAGFETSSTTMQYALFELAKNPLIQNKLRKEINDVISANEGNLTYDAIHQMEYLGRVVDETLRKYPPATNLSRVCTKEYKIPGTDTVIEKGTQMSVSVYGIHMDDRYYPDPEKFDPDRFTESQKSSRPSYTYMPFGEGPRTCIGQRLGLTQTKVGLATIISNFEILISKDHTPVPPVYDPKSFFSAPKNGMPLKAVPLIKTDNK